MFFILWKKFYFFFLSANVFSYNPYYGFNLKESIEEMWENLKIYLQKIGQENLQQIEKVLLTHQ